jgi:ectoine hydroxylase-related dioxygenase (phytanoyl-CoA dioxygenase family)
VDEAEHPVRLAEADRAFYREHGYLLVRNAVPAGLLARAQALIEPWVDASVASWRSAGLIDGTFQDDDFWHRFMNAWVAAGRPHFRRSPNHFLINGAMYDFIRSKVLLDLAEQVIGTTELSMHGIFNARPQLPHHPDTMTPWHQDSQYWDLDYGNERDVERSTHVVTMWMPLQDVDATSGTLQVISRRETRDVVFAPQLADYDRTGFLRIAPDDIARFTPRRMSMSPGDVLLFNQRTPHAAAPNEIDRIRWSVDVRYEATATATVVGSKYGFVAQSLRDPASETSLEEWLKKRQAPSPFAPQAVPLTA